MSKVVKEMFKDQPILCEQIKSVTRIDTKGTYLVQVEVGDKRPAEVQNLLEKIRQIFVNNKINKAIYVPTTNGVSWVDLSKLNKKEIKKMIKNLQKLIED